MKSLIAALVSLAVLTGADVALGQHAYSLGERDAYWLDEQWGYGLSVGEYGWELLRPAPSTETTMVVAMRPAGVEEGALCQLEYWTRTGLAAQTREQLNANTHRLLNGPAMERARTTQEIQRAEVSDVGGVAVLDIRSRIEDQQTFARRFWLQRGDEVRTYLLACVADQENEAGIQGMEAVAASLRFWEQQ